MGSIGKEWEMAPETTCAHLGIESIDRFKRMCNSLMNNLQTGKVLASLITLEIFLD